MVSSSPQELYAYTQIHRTHQEVTLSPNYDPIPLRSSEQLLNATHPIPMDFLRRDLSAQQRQDVYRHIVETVERSNQSASFLEAAEITKNALVAIHFEEMTEVTSTSTSETANYATTTANTSSTLDGTIFQGPVPHAQLNMAPSGIENNANGRQPRLFNSTQARRVNDFSEPGRGPPSIPSSVRSVFRTSSTTRAQGRSTPSSSTTSASPTSASSTLNTARAEVGSTSSSTRRYAHTFHSNPPSVYEVETASTSDSAHTAATTASSSIKVELVELDRRLNELDDLMDEYDEPRVFKDARQASRTARQVIFQARSKGGDLQAVLLEAQDNMSVAEQIVENALTEIAIRASMSAIAPPSEHSAQAEPSRLGEQVADLIDMARDIRLGANRSQANPGISPRVGEAQDKPTSSSSSAIDDIRLRREAERERDSDTYRSYSLPPHQASAEPPPDYAPSAYQAPDAQTSSNGYGQEARNTPLAYTRENISQRVPTIDAPPTHYSRLHYLHGHRKDVVCRCSAPDSHRDGDLSFVKSPEIYAKCMEYFRLNPRAMCCAKEQWRTLEIDDSGHHASHQPVTGSSRLVPKPLEGGLGRKIGDNLYVSNSRFIRRRR